MSSHEVLKIFYSRLVGSLPMDDPLFIAELRSHGLLPADAEDRIETKSTRVEKGRYFFSNVIMPSLVIDDSHFMELLNIMQQSKHFHLEQLSVDIKHMLKMQSSDTAG